MNIKHIYVNDKRNADFKWYLAEPRSYYLFVLFKTPVMVLIDGFYMEADAGTCVIYDKNTIQGYFPQKNQEFVHDYIQFELDEKEEKKFLSEIPPDKLLPIYVISELVDFLKLLFREYHANTPYKNAVLSCLGTAFLYKIQNELQQEHISPEKKLHFEQLYMLRKEIYDQPQLDWTVEKMSKQVHMSGSYLQILYKRFFQESCMNDVIRARMKRAKELLQYTDMKVQTVSESCGYKNIEHFTRQFKRLEGLTPLHYRQSTNQKGMRI